MASFVIPVCRTWLPLRLPDTRGGFADETDRLSDGAGEHLRKVAKARPGDLRFRPLPHIASGYEHARPTMTSWEVFNEG
jgi:hypothetical protein